MWRARFAHRREGVCTIPPGGSSDIGTLGYVNGALELAAQIEAGTAPRPSVIHVAAGTLGTVAGIGIGLAWGGLDIPVVATRITSRLITNDRMLAALVRSTLARLGAAGAANAPAAEDALRLITLRHDQIGAGYGQATDAGRHATAVFADAGLRLDATYTAKAAASLLADARAGAGAPADGNVAGNADGNAGGSVAGNVGGEDAALPLFWNTLSAVEPEHLTDGTSAADLPAPFARYLSAAG
jgi:D-cysteine desulfhydrase